MQEKQDKHNNDGMITANEIGEVLQNITLTEKVPFVLDGGEGVNIIKIQKKII